MPATRTGDILKLLVNKVEVATGTFTGSVFDGAADVLVGQGADGIIDELRYVNADKSTTLTQVATTYTYNERNQLVTETTGSNIKTYTYDKNGNNTGTETKVGTTVLATESMTYDELNRMLSNTGPRGTDTFTYRGAKWHRASTGTTQFLYDGDNVLADLSSGNIVATYVTPMLDQNLSMTTGGNTYYYSQDGLNSVRTLTDSLASIANRYDYLPFGVAFSPNTNVTKEQRYTYTGREINNTSLYLYFRYRQYDSNIGRFISRDPIGTNKELEREIYSKHPVYDSVRFMGEDSSNYTNEIGTIGIDPHGLIIYKLVYWTTTYPPIFGTRGFIVMSTYAWCECGTKSGPHPWSHTFSFAGVTRTATGNISCDLTAKPKGKGSIKLAPLVRVNYMVEHSRIYYLLFDTATMKFSKGMDYSSKYSKITLHNIDFIVKDTSSCCYK